MNPLHTPAQAARAVTNQAETIEAMREDGERRAETFMLTRIEMAFEEMPDGMSGPFDDCLPIPQQLPL